MKSRSRSACYPYRPAAPVTSPAGARFLRRSHLDELRRPSQPRAAVMIAISNLTKYYGEQTLFAGVNLHLNTGACYGVVGANGSGKSTFLRLLAGDEVPSDGTISIPKRARVGVLRQDHFAYEEEPIVHVAMMGRRELWAAIAEKERILALPREQFDAEDRKSVVEGKDGGRQG